MARNEITVRLRFAWWWPLFLAAAHVASFIHLLGAVAWIANTVPKAVRVDRGD